MRQVSKSNSGIQLLLKRARDSFRGENKNYYSEKDYRDAERKFVKYALGQSTIQVYETFFLEGLTVVSES
jgi:hypothetical protein